MMNIGATKPVTKDTMPILTDVAGMRFLGTNRFINCPSKVGMYKKGECECDNIKKDSSVNWSEEETLKII